MKRIKIISLLLALLFIFSAVPATVWADGDDDTADTEVVTTVGASDDADADADADDPDADDPDADEEEEGEGSEDKGRKYLNEGFETREEKLKTMEAVYEQDNIRIWLRISS